MGHFPRWTSYRPYSSICKRHIILLEGFSYAIPSYPGVILYSSINIPTQPTCQRDILRLYGDSLGMDGTQIRISKEWGKVRFGSFLKGTNRRWLKSKVRFEILRDFANKPLKWQFAYKQICWALRNMSKLYSREGKQEYLIASDLPESNGTWPISTGSFDCVVC